MNNIHSLIAKYKEEKVMKIFYFTSTGNSLLAAKTIGGELTSIPKILRSSHLQFRDECIGLVFPIYGLSVPPIVLEFIQKAELKSNYLFAVLTYGTYDAGAVTQLERESSLSKVKFDYINTLHMQENYIPGFAMERQREPKNQRVELKRICDEINKRKSFIKKNMWFDNLMTKLHQKNYHYKRGTGITEDIQINERCIGCGICEKLCPTNNIHMEKDRPLYEADCLSCLACVQNCPQSAISLTTEKSRERYRNPHIDLKEIIDANI